MSAPSRADFDRVAAANTRATLGLVRLFEAVQRDPMLRPISDKVFTLLADELAFAVEFERKLSDVADYVAAWKYLCAKNGRAPARSVFEELLASGAAETVQESEPVVESAFVEQARLPLPAVEAEPPPVEGEPEWRGPSRELAEQLLRERTVWGREASGGPEPAA